MPGKVADASVLGAVVFGEPRSEEAGALIRDAELYAPTLLAYELASITRKKIVRYPQQRAALMQALEMALALHIHWVEVDHLQVVQLALDQEVTTCDASYLSVARALGIPLATLDERLRRISRRLGG